MFPVTASTVVFAAWPYVRILPRTGSVPAAIATWLKAVGAGMVIVPGGSPIAAAIGMPVKLVPTEIVATFPFVIVKVTGTPGRETVNAPMVMVRLGNE